METADVNGMDLGPHSFDFSRCAGCPFEGQFVPAKGDARCPCFVVGTAPGEADEKTGEPFTGPAGALVRDAVEAHGVKPFYTNVIKRRPPRAPKPKECIRCGFHLIEEMKRAQVKYILTLGSIPFRFLYGMSDLSLEEVRGLPLRLDRFGMEFTVIATYDPGYVLRTGKGLNNSVGHEWLSDIEDFVDEFRRYTEAA